MKKPYFKVFKGRVRWYFNLTGANGEIMFQSEGYWSKGNATRAAVKLAEAMGVKVVRDE